jgi:hypothetical protein
MSSLTLKELYSTPLPSTVPRARFGSNIDWPFTANAVTEALKRFDANIPLGGSCETLNRWC